MPCTHPFYVATFGFFRCALDNSTGLMLVTAMEAKSDSTLIKINTGGPENT
jgi:hypothetical protein